MIRSFDWRDVGLVKSLSGQGICLDSETGLTRGHRPLPHALLAYLMPGSGAPTLVWRANGNAAIGQLRLRPGDEQARVLFIAPACYSAAAGWLHIAERLAVEAGSLGAHNLIAEVNENTHEFEALRAAGFAIYARQSLWKLSGPAPTPSAAVSLRVSHNADHIGIQTLYGNIVPRLVQQVEAAPSHMRGYVLEDDGEITAFVSLRRGPLGIWLEPYLHPEAFSLSEAALYTALNLIPDRNGRPVYVCVRRYQDWLQDILSRGAFEVVGSQAAMVKRLTVRVSEPVLKALPAMEGKVPTPIVRVTKHDPPQGLGAGN
jgi:hypothetical protein